MFNQTSLELKPSYLVAGVITLPYLAALYLVCTHEINWLVKLSLVLIILCIYGYQVMHSALLRTNTSIKSVTITAKEICIHFDSKEKYRARLLGKALVSRFFCLIYLKHEPSQSPTQNKLFSALTFHQQIIIVCPENVTCQQSYRRFRVLLRFGQHKHCKISPI